MPSKNHRQSMSPTERAFWRDIYRAAVEALILRHDGKAATAQVETDASAHADAAVRQLRLRNTWSPQ